MLGKTLESPLDYKDIKPVNPKGNQPWIFIGRTDAEAPILWPPDVNSWLIGKYPDAGKDWRQKEKRVTEDEMVGWHHQCNGHELGQTPGDGKRCMLQSMWLWSQKGLGDWITRSAYIFLHCLGWWKLPLHLAQNLELILTQHFPLFLTSKKLSNPSGFYQHPVHYHPQF